eukprot:TRINITY_DN781884_c0_g1_i1.p1 TRINITY_DN781884_c0_g1~~TRINITY_DN781884_c0_g1_i1.p1  ORF type:complete len:423 (+),score=127.48 TRINITY_DN781884_c0_g1_i1:117-1385(+)
MEGYDLIREIGKGSFGRVCKIKRKSDSKTLVWKELNYGTMREKEKELVVSEVNILRELRHPFIVRYYDRIIDRQKTTLYIVQEFCEGGDLSQQIRILKERRQYVDEKTVWKIFAQIILALKHCHRHKESGVLKPILHRDIKPGNIFLDGNNNVKIGDFGLAKELSSASKFATTNVGTPYYMSPELMGEKKYNDRSDVWAVGCVIYELCALRPPFRAENQLNLALRINRGIFDRIPSKFSDELHKVIAAMLRIDPNQRPSVERLERCTRLKENMDQQTLVVRDFQRARNFETQHSSLAKVKDDLDRRQKVLEAREAKLAEFEENLRKQQRELEIRERALVERERALERKGEMPSRTTTEAPVSKIDRSWQQPRVGTTQGTGIHPSLRPSTSAGGVGGNPYNKLAFANKRFGMGGYYNKPTPTF